MQDTFVNYIKTEQISFKYAKGSSVLTGREFHIYYEIVLFLGGECDFISENLKCHLAPNTLVVIPKEKYHCFYFKGNSNNYYRCILNFYDVGNLKKLINDTITEIRVISDVHPQIISHFKRLIEKEKSNIPDYQKEIILTSVLSEIIIDIHNNAAPANENSQLSLLTQKVIEYINNNFENTITVDSIARQFNVSASSLSHIFKSDLHTSVYKYILNKRLITAQKLIVEGTPAIQAALQCGFNDYSGFFKAYKKYFYSPPSMNKSKYKRISNIYT